jgi:hypothetical protein
MVWESWVNAADSTHEIWFVDRLGEPARLISGADNHSERPWINDTGQVIWAGTGGLSGTTSGKTDLEIFYYDTNTGELVQITDNNLSDQFPIINNGNQIVWYGNHNLAGFQTNEEIFLATVIIPEPGMIILLGSLATGLFGTSWVRRHYFRRPVI